MATSGAWLVVLLYVFCTSGAVQSVREGGVEHQKGSVMWQNMGSRTSGDGFVRDFGPDSPVTEAQSPVLDVKESAIKKTGGDMDAFACWNEGVRNELMHKRFLDFFVRSDRFDMADFKANYLEQLSKRSDSKILGFLLDSSDNSLAKAFLSALNTYAIAGRPEINRAFQFFQLPWNHYPLTDFFEDFSESTSFPLLPTTTYSAQYEPFKLRYNDADVSLIGPDTIAIQNGWRSHDAVTVEKVMKKVLQEEGQSATFEANKNLTRSLWNPKPAFKQVLESLWCTATQASNGSYLALHIPFMKDTRNFEATSETASKYFNVMQDLCGERWSTCPENVVVIHENEELFREIKFLASAPAGGFNVMDFTDLVFKNEMSIESYAAPISEDLLTYIKPGTRKRELWTKRNTEMMLSITIMAMAERVACHKSEDVCHLTALLRGQDRDFIFDIDPQVPVSSATERFIEW